MRLIHTLIWSLCLALGCSPVDDDGAINANSSLGCTSDAFCEALHQSSEFECRELEGGAYRCAECLEHEECPADFRCSGSRCVEGERNRSRCSNDEQCTELARSPTFRDKFNDTAAVVCAELEDGYMNCSECPPGVGCPDGLSCVDGMFCQ